MVCVTFVIGQVLESKLAPGARRLPRTLVMKGHAGCPSLLKNMKNMKNIGFLQSCARLKKM